MQPNDSHRPQEWHSNPGLIPGVIVIAIGVLFLLGNFHIFYLRDWWLYWPVVLIALGLVKLVDSTFASGRVVGGVLVVIGALFLARNLGILDVRMRDLWPLFLIGAGLLMLWNRTAGFHERISTGERPRFRSSSENVLNLAAIFSGGKRYITTQDFQGGQVIAIFGGWELDFRKAGMAADSAVLEINAMFGGAEVRIPENWIAVVQGVGIFGGYGDESQHPDGNMPGVKRLIVKGAAVFGGVNVKN
jgi:predicted membrane protein